MSAKPAYARGAAERLFGPTPASVDVLRTVFALIRTPARYTTSGYALRADGGVCGEGDPDAVRFSLHGAVWRACPQVSKAGGDRRVAVIKLLDRAAQELGHARIEAVLGDHFTVLECITRAGRLAKEAA